VLWEGLQLGHSRRRSGDAGDWLAEDDWTVEGLQLGHSRRRSGDCGRRPGRSRRDRCFNWATPAGGVETYRTGEVWIEHDELQLGHSRRRSGDFDMALILLATQERFNWATPAGGVETRELRFALGRVIHASIGPLPQAEWRLIDAAVPRRKE